MEASDEEQVEGDVDEGRENQVVERTAAVTKAFMMLLQAISMVLCLIHLSKKGMPYQLQWRKLRFDREMLGQMVRYGLPSGVQNSVIGLANVILQSNINSFGKLAMAGYGAYSKLEGFAFLPITSFTMALTTYTGQNLGAMQYDRAKKGARFGILVSITLAELIGVGMYVFASAADLDFYADSGGHRPRHAAGANHCAVLLPAGLFPRRRLGLPRCGQGFRTHDDHAGNLVRTAHCLYHDGHAHRARNSVHLLGYPLTWSVSSVIYFIYYHRSDWIHGFEAKEH